jgi:hypothetical protein
MSPAGCDCQERKDMRMIRAATWFALVALALAWTAPAGAAPLLAMKDVGDDADKWVVDDADFVLVFNMKQLAGSELMKKGGIESINGLVKTNEQAQALIEATGLDPFKDIDSILVSGTLNIKGADARGLVVVKGRFDPSKALAVARKKKDVEVLTGGAAPIIKLKVHDHNLFGAFANKTTLVVTLSKDATADWVKTGGKKQARVGKTLRSALGGFKGSESLSFALVVTDDLKERLGKVPQLAVAGPKLQTLTASFTITDSAEVKIVGATSDEKAARQLQNAISVLKGVAEVMLQGQDDALGKKLGDVLDEVKVTSDKSGVQISCKLSKDKINKLNKADQ